MLIHLEMGIPLFLFTHQLSCLLGKVMLAAAQIENLFDTRYKRVATQTIEIKLNKKMTFLEKN